MKTLIIVIILSAGWCSWALGVETGKFAEPILLTSCGQSADVLMMKTLLTKDSLSFVYTPVATANDLAGAGSVIVVLGGSSKGLGAAKISAEEETARASALLSAAHEAGIPVVAVHLGGMARRGTLSDDFIRLGAERSQQLIVVKGGNEDGLFTVISEQQKIPLRIAETALKVSAIMRELYGKP